MYIETSSPRSTGDSAILQTPTLMTSSEAVCLSFWYKMMGGTFGMLKVKAIRDNKEVTLWQNNGKSNQYRIVDT